MVTKTLKGLHLSEKNSWRWHFLSLKPLGWVAGTFLILVLTSQFMMPEIHLTHLLMMSFVLIFSDLERMFQNDWREGRLEWWLAEGINIHGLILKRFGLYALTTGVPLVGIMSIWGIPDLRVSLSLALALLSWMSQGLVFSTLLLGMERPHWLLILLMVPLALPQFLLVDGVVYALQQNEPMGAILGLQLGLNCVSLSMCLGLGPISLRWAVE